MHMREPAAADPDGKLVVNALRRNLLPIILAALPLLAALLIILSTLDAFSGLSNLAGVLFLVFFLAPILFYDWIGLIHFNILGGGSEPWAADSLYLLSTSLVLFLCGQLFLWLRRR